MPVIISCLVQFCSIIKAFRGQFLRWDKCGDDWLIIQYRRGTVSFTQKNHFKLYTVPKIIWISAHKNKCNRKFMAFELLQYMTSAFAAYAVVLQTIWPVFTQRQCTQTYKDQEGGGEQQYVQYSTTHKQQTVKRNLPFCFNTVQPNVALVGFEPRHLKFKMS